VAYFAITFEKYEGEEKESGSTIRRKTGGKMTLNWSFCYFTFTILFLHLNLTVCFNLFMVNGKPGFAFHISFRHLLIPIVAKRNAGYGRRLACLCRKSVALKSDHIRGNYDPLRVYIASFEKIGRGKQ
jgi:hypothetical protein